MKVDTKQLQCIADVLHTEVVPDYFGGLLTPEQFTELSHLLADLRKAYQTQTIWRKKRGSIVVPINCTITGWYLLADASGSISLTVTKTTYSNYPSGSSILTPSLSSAQKGSASGLSISCSKDDILTVTVDSCSTIKFCELVLVTMVS